MRECSNVRMRELLPDLEHDRLDAEVRAEVEAHLVTCGDCQAELRLLRQVVAVTGTPRVDTARIVAALPSPRGGRTRVWNMRSPLLQLAAALVLVAGATVIGLRLDRRPDARSASPAPQVATHAAQRPAAAAANAVAAARPVTTTELPVGEPLHDLSDGELRALLAEIESLDAVTSSETEVVVPSIGRSGA